MTAADYYGKVREAADAIAARVPSVPSIGVVLGSGLGDFADSLDASVSLPYAELPHWPASTAVGHEGRLLIGTVRGRVVAALAGRLQACDGHAPPTVTFAAGRPA